MVALQNMRSGWRLGLVAGLLASGVVADRIIETSGFKMCSDESYIKVQKAYISYNHDKGSISFDVSGSSSGSRYVSAELEVVAYGRNIYNNEFDPCSEANFIEQLCPLPEQEFIAHGSQAVPEEGKSQVPDIAFQIPDISATGTLKLKDNSTEEVVACIQLEVTNGKTTKLPAVSYVAAGVIGASVLASGASAITSAVYGPGSGPITPGLTEMVGWFQGMAMNGMLSVDYPPVYQSFSQNFGFSAGLVAWEPVQRAIDDFRAKTGGNLTGDSVPYLKNTTGGGLFQTKRAFEQFELLAIRDLELRSEDTVSQTVSGIKAFAEKLRVPGSDIFMTILLIVAIIIAGIVFFMVLFKGLLELWAKFGSFPQSLAGFRKHYWGSIGRVITMLILMLYGIWVLYCVFQFTRGDSWAATTLAAVTLAIFTSVLAFFSWRIWRAVRIMKERDGHTGALYDDKETWTKYSIFYDSYKRDYWWVFVPFILYMAIKGIVIAAGDGAGKSQTIAILIVEAIMLGLLLWSRPFEEKSHNILNIVIQVVRVLSVVCVLVFVREFGISQDTKTVTGVALIAVQSTLTGVLALLLVAHVFMAMCETNKHRKRRKEAEKMQHDMDDLTPLTPLDGRISIIAGHKHSDRKSVISIATSHRQMLDHSSGRPDTPDHYYAADAHRWSMASQKNSSRNLTSPNNGRQSYQYSMDGARGYRGW
ncbi:unnamed protein product [Clonostachys chloroleuca]|uniref:ML-like domain-containing protein n=1 Tax=Clonostachys chloroleuca TaxID=1926264 RepID=A0AA35PU21_9HYPO|nr:unnamed protein product [Clonostachys chloroleuca]